MNSLHSINGFSAAFFQTPKAGRDGFATSRCVIAQTARGCLPTTAVICAKVFSLPLPPRVQKNATSGSWLAVVIKYARAGELSDQAQTGVPMTTRSYDETSCFFGAMVEGRFRRASSNDRI